MMRVQRGSVVLVGEERVVVRERVEGQVGSVAAVAVRHDVCSLRTRLDEIENLRARHAFPGVFEAAPLCDAVEL